VSAPGPAHLRQRAVLAVATVLGISPMVVTSAGSLFDLPGFDSLAVVAVLDRIEADLGTEVPPEAIVPEAFESIGALAALLSQALASAPAAARSGGRR
jgi:acyl carrier protein